MGDRFYLGGPSSIRGFESLGLGPRSLASTPTSGDYYSSTSNRGDALGGVGKLAAVCDLQLPFPTLPPLPPRAEFLRALEATHLVFAVSTGWLHSPYSWGEFLVPSLSSTCAQIRREARVSASLGFAVPLPQFGGELLFTYSVPIKAAASDVCKQWQLGFGLGFGL